MTRIATGDLSTVARAVKATLETNPTASILIFDDETSHQVELDLRGSVDDVLARLLPPPLAPITAGRPKLGVVAREVTLLPRHWEWLATQPSGASVALRKLVDEARKASTWQDALRQQQEVTYRFLSAIAGNLPTLRRLPVRSLRETQTPFPSKCLPGRPIFVSMPSSYRAQILLYF